MNYDNITKENFKEYEIDFYKVIDNMENIFSEHQHKNSRQNEKTILIDSEGNNLFKKFNDSLNIGFSKLFKFSHKNNIFFDLCSSIVYENTFENRFNDFQNEFIDVKKIEFIEREYDIIINTFFIYKKRVNWGVKELELLKNAEIKKINFLETLLVGNGCTSKTTYVGNDFMVSGYLKVAITENRNETPIPIKPKTNKSLMFEGTNLNIKDRYRILNKVLDFDKKVHPLNIGELEKYQLLAYILGIDKDNARKLMCGSHDAKDNDLTTYFNELGLNK